MKILLVISFLFLCACNQEKTSHYDSVESAIRKYFKAKSEGIIIDSIDLYLIDTLTSRKIEEIKARNYLDEGAEVMKIIQEKLQLEREILSIHQLFGMSKSQYKNATDQLSEVEELKKEVERLTDSAKRHLRIAESVDSHDFKGFLANYNIFISDSLSGVQQKVDSIILILSPTYRVIEKNSIINY
ncbi:MAG: hypothetical protein J0M30_14745 [Chitinophagales bacterium]|nr:hypothetical protein [Chitinophagales bacterium]